MKGSVKRAASSLILRYVRCSLSHDLFDRLIEMIEPLSNHFIFALQKAKGKDVELEDILLGGNNKVSHLKENRRMQKLSQR
jgi:hypothetical protein